MLVCSWKNSGCTFTEKDVINGIMRCPKHGDLVSEDEVKTPTPVTASIPPDSKYLPSSAGQSNKRTATSKSKEDVGLIVVYDGIEYRANCNSIKIGRQVCFSEDLRMKLYKRHPGVSRNHLLIEHEPGSSKISLRELAGEDGKPPLNRTWVGGNRITTSSQIIDLPVTVTLGDPTTNGAVIEVKNDR